jgi:ABC-type nitrate/sulfonate/bicarbonate transport system substrate-binding protein
VGDLPVARASLDYPGLAVLAVIGRSPEDRWVLARPGSGIATSADLRGHKIATQRGSGSHYVLGRVLSSRGMTEKDVTLYDLGPDEVGEVFARGDIDAFTTERPFSGPASVHYGLEVIELHDPEAYALTYDLVAMKSLRLRVETATALLRALAEAGASPRLDADFAALLRDEADFFARRARAGGGSERAATELIDSRALNAALPSRDGVP